MKNYMVCAILLGLGATLNSAAFAKDKSAEACREVAGPALESGHYSADDMRQLACWLSRGSQSAGMELARGYRLATPPRYEQAREILKDLAKGQAASEATYRTVPMGNGQFGIMASNSKGGMSRLPSRSPFPPAQRELAKMLLAGEGGDVDVAGAKRLLKMAEKAGDAEAAILRKVLIAKGTAKD
jgi:TPR repeat protein